MESVLPPRLRIVADEAIPYLKGVLEPYAEVRYRKGAAIGPDDVRDADALLVRTRTRCDAALLAGSRVKFVGSATIGADHVDLPALEAAGIAFANVPGCNAGGVMQYVFTALYGIACRGNGRFPGDPGGRFADGRTFGIVGAGHVGSRVAQLARRLGFRVLLNDPPREAREGTAAGPFVPLAQLLAESDVVTVHVPLLPDTRGLIGRGFLAGLRPGAVLLNTSRGEVADGQALKEALQSGRPGALVLDVWPGEPCPDPVLLAGCDIASPHIAGYSREGKINGTKGVVRALAACFGLEDLADFDPGRGMEPGPVLPPDAVSWDNARMAGFLEAGFGLPEISRRLKADPASFEAFRNGFYFRPEFSI